MKKAGEQSTYTVDGDAAVKFKVTSIQVGAPCHFPYDTKNGQIVVVSLDIETTATLAKVQTKTWWTMQEWKAIDANGMTMNGNPVAGVCLAPNEQLPVTIGPAEKANGKLAFDVPAGSGTLIYTAPGAPFGWEWTYPAS
ncbi:hypothetical protein [Arthrobacter bambusae]|uniref:DUF4352 domain-containing protein n=1 Tax=Arthrobacter bambusae TaxID=1338426 RepID=A0AAW8DHX2_9MICC|nr:hypothetical protein [Arthrobacter bambusae]MDP9905622.1 hypothetical protein [Arthrobacter bambusae]MDQ0127296.1 hypothetical protein [Arthrobacter bambusae]MDQ0178638.1 hypothetical protein [Arthrobacter bambusae]